MTKTLEDIQVLEPHVGSKTSSDDDTQQHHDLLPPGLLLVLQGLLCVIGGPGGVLHRALHMRINPTESIEAEFDKCSRFPLGKP